MGTTAAIVLLLLILAALLYPLWRPPLMALGAALGPASRMATLQERKLALYGAIREVGFDLRTDKVSEADYDAEVERLKAEAVEVVAQIEALGSLPPVATDALELLISKAAAGRISSDPEPVSTDAAGEATFCTQCGRQALDSDRFCAGCGAQLHHTAQEKPGP